MMTGMMRWVNSEYVPITEDERVGLCRKTLQEDDTTNVYTNINWDNKECKKSDGSDKDKGNGKLLVVTPHTAAFLIKMQKLSLDLFLMEPYDYVVYDDSYTHAHFSNWNVADVPSIIKNVTESIGGIYKRAPMSFHADRRCLFPQTIEPYSNNANTRCSDIYQFIYRDNDVQCRNGKVLFLDADVFLISPYYPSKSIVGPKVKKVDGSGSGSGSSEEEEKYVMASVPQNRPHPPDPKFNNGISNITYFWTAVNLMDIPKLPARNDMNWDCGAVYYPTKTIYLDSGGHTYEWINKYKPNIHWYDVKYIYDIAEAEKNSENGDWSEMKNEKHVHGHIWKWFAVEWQKIYSSHKLYDLEFKSQLLGGLFLHLRNAGNWMQHGKKYKWIQPEQAKLINRLFDRLKKIHHPQQQQQEHQEHQDK